MLPVLFHLLPRLYQLWLWLDRCAGLLDLDFVEMGGEGVVDVELVARLDLLATWRLDQDPLPPLTNSEGLEGFGELSALSHSLVFHQIHITNFSPVGD